jgi:TRAP-type uncharacterized transport system substrate-binding protein
MGRWDAQVALRCVAAVLAVLAVTWLALWYFIPPPPSTITIAAGFKNGAFDHIAERYRERLARHQVTLNVYFTGEGTAESLRVVNDPKSGVVAAFLFAGMSDGARSPDLVSLGRINYAPLWIFYKGAEPIERLTQLKGKRVNIPSIAGPLANPVLTAHGVTSDNITILQDPGLAGVENLEEGKVDVAIMAPVDMEAPITQRLLRNPAVRLMNVAQADTITRLFPSLHKVVLTQGMVDLDKNIPPTDVNLLASTDVVVVRKELHSDLKLLLAQTASEVHGGAGGFQRAGEFPTQTDLEFPIAEEAVDFYRNGPSFFHRYLPFWMISYAKRFAAIFVTVIAIVIPIFSFAPRIYAWLLQNYTEKLYRRLRAIETTMKADLTPSQIKALQADLENIDRAAHIVPMRRSSQFFDLIMHIDLTRTRLTSRLGTMQHGQAA